MDALPTALIKPLSGSGARGLMVETMKTLGPDSFAGRLACVIQGSTETTFYILAVYFGSVGVKNTRHALGCGLAADAAGVVARDPGLLPVLRLSLRGRAAAKRAAGRAGRRSPAAPAWPATALPRTSRRTIPTPSAPLPATAARPGCRRGAVAW